MKEEKEKKNQPNNQPIPRKNKQTKHKNKPLQDTETDGACQHLLQQGKKFIMEVTKQV